MSFAVGLLGFLPVAFARVLSLFSNTQLVCVQSCVELVLKSLFADTSGHRERNKNTYTRKDKHTELHYQMDMCALSETVCVFKSLFSGYFNTLARGIASLDESAFGLILGRA